MCGGKEELSGVMVSLFRCAGACVGTIAAAGKKIASLVPHFGKETGVGTIAAADKKVASVEPHFDEEASVRTIEDAGKKVACVVPHLDEEVSVKIKQQPSRAASKVGVPSLSAVTNKQIRTAVFDRVTDKILFAKAVSDIVNQDVVVRLDAVRTMAGINHELSVKALVAQVAHDPSAQIRQECIKALTALGMKEGLSAVERALADEVDLVRLAAVCGLYRLAGAQSGAALVGMFSDENEGVRRRAITCVGWLGQGRLAVELPVLLDDESVSVRRAAAEAMGSLGNRQVVLSLIEHLKDPDEATRKSILDAIEKITGKKIGKSFPENKETLDRLIERWRQWWKEEMLYPSG